MARVVWTQSALEQLLTLVAPITEVDPEMGASIIDRIEAGLQRLESFPDSASFYREPVRRITIHKLPYTCYYECMDDVVYILAIRHDRQRQPEL